MKRKRHTPEQIVRKLREGDRMLNEGTELTEVLRHLEVSESSWARWRAQYGGMKADEAKRLKELERENARLKKLLAEADSKKRCSRSWLRETSNPGASPASGEPLAGRLRGLRTVRVSGRGSASFDATQSACAATDRGRRVAR